MTLDNLGHSSRGVRAGTNAGLDRRSLHMLPEPMVHALNVVIHRSYDEVVLEILVYPRRQGAPGGAPVPGDVAVRPAAVDPAAGDRAGRAGGQIADLIGGTGHGGAAGTSRTCLATIT